MPHKAPGIEVRCLAARDSLSALTQLLNRAYEPLAARGLPLPEASQGVADTQQRVAQGQCFVATQQGQLVGTVTVYGAHEAVVSAAVPFRSRDTAHLHQFAVAPELRRQGLGRRLVAACEQWSRERGYDRVAVDVAEAAADLQALYRRLGYAEVSRLPATAEALARVVMEKPLHHSPLRDHLRLLARHHLWATRRLLSHVDAVPEADYRRDLGLFFRSLHGTLNHLLLAEQALWLRRFTEGHSPVLPLDSEIEPGRAALRGRLEEAALTWLPLIDVWPEARLMGSLSYQRANGQSATLPFAAALIHVFNHATHHRGQISAGLTGLGRSAPEMDLALMLVEEDNPT